MKVPVAQPRPVVKFTTWVALMYAPLSALEPLVAVKPKSPASPSTPVGLNSVAETRVVPTDEIYGCPPSPEQAVGPLVANGVDALPNEAAALSTSGVPAAKATPIVVNPSAIARVTKTAFFIPL